MRMLFAALLPSFLAISQLASAAHQKPYAKPVPMAPEPAKEITPAYYAHQDGYSIGFNAEFLYWYTKESNLSYAMKVLRTPVIPPGNISVYVPEEIESIEPCWNPGFRVGVWFQLPIDGWDVTLNWTRIHNDCENRTVVPTFANTVGANNIPTPAAGQSALLGSWTTPVYRNINANEIFYFESVSAKWDFKFNVIDLELGRKFWISNYLTLRPFTALRGAWVDADIRADYRLPIPNSVAFRQLCKYDRDYWGVGLLAGLQPTWYMTKNFSLYGNLDVSLLWGQHTNSQKRTTFNTEAFINTNVSSTLKDSYYCMQAILDMAIGLQWEQRFSCDRYLFALSAGWESHYWLNYGRVTTIHEVVNVSGQAGFHEYDFDLTDLILSGLVIRAQFTF